MGGHHHQQHYHHHHHLKQHPPLALKEEVKAFASEALQTAILVPDALSDCQRFIKSHNPNIIHFAGHASQVCVSVCRACVCTCVCVFLFIYLSFGLSTFQFVSI